MAASAKTATVTALLLFAPLLAPYVTAEEHSLIRPVPDSVAVTNRVTEDGELVVTYRQGGRRERRNVRGRMFGLEYDVSDTAREDIVEHFKGEVERLDGTILRETENQLTFRVIRDGGGDSWAMLWATDGNYTLEIVDEPAKTPRTILDSEEGAVLTTASEVEAERIEFVSEDLPPGAGAVLDRVAKRLLSDPSLRAKISGQGAHVVSRALELYGIESTRLDVEDDPGAVLIEILPGR